MTWHFQRVRNRPTRVMTICIEVATEEAAAGGRRAIPLGKPEIRVFRSPDVCL
jgi:hypothetical protein